MFVAVDSAPNCAYITLVAVAMGKTYWIYILKIIHKLGF